MCSASFWPCLHDAVRLRRVEDGNGIIWLWKMWSVIQSMPTTMALPVEAATITPSASGTFNNEDIVISKSLQRECHPSFPRSILYGLQRGNLPTNLLKNAVNKFSPLLKVIGFQISAMKSMS
ncbi:hypothetical protein SUGI_0981030 [Cryptomeria japonica]|nr:hypothetical protein SUGI_0981030 [Cryptomeria japonica]